MRGSMKIGLFCATALTIFAVGCQTTPTQTGAMEGAILGAGAGAVIGNQSHGRSGEGALIGAGLGALTGALIGDHVDERRSNRSGQAYARPQPAPAPQAPAASQPAPTGHWETRTTRTASGETYEERVWVPNN